MLRSEPVGWPAMAMAWIGMIAFVAAMAVARRRGGREARAATTRSPQSIVGIAVQGFALFLACAGMRHAMIAPTSPRALAAAAITAALMCAAVWLFVASTRAMGRNWSVVARTRSDHELVEAGPFAHVRHPIYVAFFLMMIAFAVAFGHLGRLSLTIPIYALGTWLRIRLEERLLRAKFGAAYDDYARRVKRFVPGVL